MKNFLKFSVVGITTTMLITGCSYKIAQTPAVMTYDGSNVDYSKISELKTGKICKFISSAEGDTTIIAAAKEANISHIKHIDKSYEYSTFLGFNYAQKECVTVYGN